MTSPLSVHGTTDLKMDERGTELTASMPQLTPMLDEIAVR
jgi:hypothetical protein